LLADSCQCSAGLQVQKLCPTVVKWGTIGGLGPFSTSRAIITP
jgi:hypothetical protein